MNCVVLIVDDDPDIITLCHKYLSKRGYSVLGAESAKEARAVLTERRVDVILLDVMLPDAQGFRFVNEIRKLSKAEICFLTARDAPMDRVRGLRLGSEYLTKPFELEELALRLEMLGRRGARAREDVIFLPPLVMDCVRRTVQIAGSPVSLTDSEFRLLERLAQTPGVPVAYESLSELLWPGEPAKSRSLMTHISAIRRKLCADGRPRVRIVGERGRGYSLDCGDDDPPSSEKW